MQIRKYSVLWYHVNFLAPTTYTQPSSSVIGVKFRFGGKIVFRSNFRGGAASKVRENNTKREEAKRIGARNTRTLLKQGKTI